MRWIITKDLLEKDSVDSAVGVGSYHAEGDAPGKRSWHGRNRHLAPSARDAMAQAVVKNSPEKFRHEFQLLDDDRIVYYQGFCGNVDNAEEAAAFAPQDWAADDSGCTISQFRKVGETE